MQQEDTPHQAGSTSTSFEDAALFFHQYPRPGKLEIQATKPLGNQRDLALAYSPGVAAPCLAIAEVDIGSCVETNGVASCPGGRAIRACHTEYLDCHENAPPNPTFSCSLTPVQVCHNCDICKSPEAITLGMCGSGTRVTRDLRRMTYLYRALDKAGPARLLSPAPDHAPVIGWLVHGAEIFRQATQRVGDTAKQLAAATQAVGEVSHRVCQISENIPAQQGIGQIT
mgnify:FL=1